MPGILQVSTIKMFQSSQWKGICFATIQLNRDKVVPDETKEKIINLKWTAKTS
jgi:hypothetical protein